jgi:hypothetical protein
VQYRRDRLLSSAAEHVDVVAYERGQPGDVLVTDIEASRSWVTAASV